MAVPEWQLPGYEKLRIEIVRVAVEDYKAALRSSAIMGKKCDKEIELEKFFLSAWGQALCGGYGRYIMGRCRKNTKRTNNKRNRHCKISDEHQKAIVTDYMNGMTYEQLAEKYGVSFSTIQYHMRSWL